MSASALVYFDLETTSLKYNAGITQIAAVWRGKKFSCYIVPTGNISYGASRITGITKDGNSLRVKGAIVEAKSTHEGISEFISWLTYLDISKNDGRPVLVSHNAHIFDIPRLLRNARNCGLEKQLIKAIDGYVDTLPLFRNQYPELLKHSQDAVLAHFGLKNESAHNAIEDVRALRAVMSKSGLFRKKRLLMPHFHGPSTLINSV